MDIFLIITSVIFALTVHEAGHILGIIMTRAGKVQGMVACWKGIGVKWEPYAYEPLKRSIVSLSGSAVNLAFAAAFYGAGLEVLGMVNLVFGVINLLPLPNSDGLRALNNLRALV